MNKEDESSIKRISTLLATYYQRAKQGKSSISYRRLAINLNLSPSYIHQVIHGKRLAKPHIYKSLIEIFDIESDKAEYILNKVYTLHGITNPQERPLDGSSDYNTFSEKSEFIAMAVDKFKFIEKWFYIPIIEATCLKEYNGDLGFICSYLNLPEGLVKDAVKEMVEAGLLKVSDGVYKKSGKNLDFSSDKLKSSITKYHLNNLNFVKEAIEKTNSKTEIDDRLVTSYTMPCLKSDLPSIRQKIYELYQLLATEFETELGDDVYLFSSQLLPLKNYENLKSGK